MLTKIAKSEVPDYRGSNKSPIRRFCEDTLREFLQTSEAGDVAEVTGAPIEMDARGTAKLASTFRNALYYVDREKDMRKHVKVMTRGGKRLFLERTQPWEPKNRIE